MNVVDTIKFIDFCKLLDRIKYSRKQNEKENNLKKFLGELRSKIQNDSSLDKNLYQVMRLLLPKLEREREPYRLKAAAMKNIIIRALGLSNKSNDAYVLNNFTSMEKGDFADTAYKILQKHFSTSDNISLAQVNKFLDTLADKYKNSKQREQEVEVLKLLKVTSPSEQKWIIRIILKELYIGLGQNKILGIFHPDAAVMIDTNNNLAKTCDILHDPSIRYAEIAVQLFTPFRPMLSQKCDGGEFQKRVKDNELYYIETKFDGERFQLHMENGKFKYFSRNSFDYTKELGDAYNNGTFTPLLKRVFKSHVANIILDGELMAWNSASNKFICKGDNFDIKKVTPNSVLKPCLIVFDMVFLNGAVLTSKPLQERLNLLKSSVTPIDNVLMLSRWKEVTKGDIVKELNISMDKNEEGIIFKKPDSLYVPNNRNAGWWKMKLEYFSGVMSDLDVIIMGGKYEKGRKMTTFIVGVLDSSTYGTGPKKYLSVARISSGLNQQELETLHGHIGNNWIQFKGSDPENYGLFFGKDKPDTWVMPEKSCVVEVRASEIFKSFDKNPEFAVGYSMRFPRILKLRLDKPHTDCLTVDEMLQLTTTRLFKRHLSIEDIELEQKKKHRSRFIVESNDVENINSNMLENKEMCVLSGYDDWNKIDVEKAIKENGGTVVKMESGNTYCILVGNKHQRVQYYKGSVDIVKLSWLQNVLNEQEFIEYEPTDVLYMSEVSRIKFLNQYDKYGDSFTENTNRAKLRDVFKSMEEKGDYVRLMNKEKVALCKELNCEMSFDVFISDWAYFDKYKVVNEPESERIHFSVITEVEFKFWGGMVSDYLNSEVNLVVMQYENEERRNELSLYLNSIHNYKAKIVTASYITDKLSERRSVSE